QPDGTYTLRKDTENWIPIYPKGAAAQVAKDSNPASSEAVNLKLASEIWLPARPWDRLEMRVATYGEHRKRIRWLVIRGKDIRPELSSLRRGFYWLSYQLGAGKGEGLVSRWYPFEESYNWQFRGLWEGGGQLGPQWVSTDPKELREEHVRPQDL